METRPSAKKDHIFQTIINEVMYHAKLKSNTVHEGYLFLVFLEKKVHFGKQIEESYVGKRFIYK